MSEWYSHFDARQLSDVMDAQHVITVGKKPGKAGKAVTVTDTKKAQAGTGKKPGRPKLKLVKMPERKGA
jgi:hypothetical protein